MSFLHITDIRIRTDGVQPLEFDVLRYSTQIKRVPSARFRGRLLLHDPQVGLAINVQRYQVLLLVELERVYGRHYGRSNTSMNQVCTEIYFSGKWETEKSPNFAENTKNGKI